jgi:hypothetical protein
MAPDVQARDTGANLADGKYCFHIETIDALGGTAESDGLTIMIDTTSPTGTVAVTPAAAGVVTGSVTVTGTADDSVSGVDTSTFHVGTASTCSTGSVIGPTWDTTTVPNGTYQVCNVIVDKAGHVGVSPLVAVTVANPVPPVVPPPPAPVNPTGTVTPAAATPPPVTSPVIANPGVDPTAPGKPTKVTVTLPRARPTSATVDVTLRWVKPTAPDLAQVVVILNLKRPPRNHTDGAKIYSGLRTSKTFKLKVGSTGYLALFASDLNRNFSSPARKVVSLAPLIPLRPTSGSSVNASPRLTWKPQTATAYYNVQLFHNGKRILTGWPTQAAFSIPAGKLQPGTYVWFVWPAVKHGSGLPTFGKLIGRATFLYTGK